MILSETPPEFVRQRTCPTMDLSNKSRVANSRIRRDSFKTRPLKKFPVPCEDVFFRLSAKFSQNLGKVTVFQFTNTILYCTHGTAVFLGNRFAFLLQYVFPGLHSVEIPRGYGFRRPRDAVQSAHAVPH